MMEGKVVLVTGGGGGIGRETALLFAKKGARVVVNDLGSSVIGEGSSSTPAEETCELIRKSGGEAIISCDSVADWKSAHRIIETAMDHYGRIDVVVNNAGNVRWNPFWEIDEEEYRSIIQVHLDGTFFVSRAAAPYFKQQNSGVYVHTTSTSGLMGNPEQAHYCAAKLGIVGLSKAIALDMKAYNVRSNCIAPYAFSRMAEGRVRDPSHLQLLARLKPEQNSQLTVALAADAAKEVNGQVFICRGNEILLAKQGFPVCSIGACDENPWSPESILERVFPSFKAEFAPLVGFGEYFSWAPL